MIDDPQQVEQLLKRLESSLPLPAIVTPELAAVIRERSSGTDPPRRCIITKTFYGGDEGGILCGLDLSKGEHAKEVFVVSLTHLDFDPGSALAGEIAAYQKHRIARLQHGGATRSGHGRPRAMTRGRRRAQASESGPDPVPKTMAAHYQALVGLTDAFCSRHLNEGYAQLARRAAAALCRKRPSPVLSGQPESWACGIFMPLAKSTSCPTRVRRRTCQCRNSAPVLVSRRAQATARPRRCVRRSASKAEIITGGCRRISPRRRWPGWSKSMDWRNGHPAPAAAPQIAS